ncbi:MAG TPA: DUF2795 domain-containing protein [Aromatoleum sp.]|uniref:DUF2795 domain-containing protein n=1 Tax=Aromatoleum sp. TaxID=2307007 RepID=UPI002B47D5B9|nr:DUF2795 domain-containing protein [Aromatoleum sp.]HJV24689.1 DUF2795 domain-containing protein [Aromatoleum sp.]
MTSPQSRSSKQRDAKSPDSAKRNSHDDSRDESRGESERRIPNPVQIQKFPGGLDYPVEKEEILEKARSEGADDLVMEALESIPDRSYESPVSISHEVGKLE